MYTKKLIRRVKVSDMDTVKARQKLVGKERDPELLERAEQIWLNMSDFRYNGERDLRMTYGDQWGDIIEVNGVKMTQRKYLQSTGNMVMQTNQIKNKVDTIVGSMVKEHNQPVCNARDRAEQQYGEVITTALQANCDANKMQSLYIKFMKDLCIRGLAVSKEVYEYKHGRLDSWTEYCEPNCVFFDSEMVDPRFWDVSLIGQFFDMPFNYLTARFAKNERDYSILTEIYNSQAQVFQHKIAREITDTIEDETEVFRTPQDNSKCRVFEIWTKETAPRYRIHDTNEGTEEVIDASDRISLREIETENKRRLQEGRAAGWSDEEIPLIEKEFFTDEFWYCRFLAPDATILWEGESPYADRSHPFSLCATPFVGGRIVGYMHDGIDHNIAMNRAIVMQDWLARADAKGVTVVPKAIVPNQDYKAFAKSWTSIDDMVFIDLKEGQEGLFPKTFYGNGSNYNAAQMIQTYKQLMEDSTAISGAIQGKTPYSGTSGTLYAQMAANSSTPIAALMTQFHTFLEELQTKKMKNIAKFYEPERLRKIAGNIDSVFTDDLNLEDVAHMEFDLALRESTDTGVYRAIINDDAKEFLMNNIITFEEYLEITSVPYADKILQGRQARQNELEQQQGAMPQQQGESYQPQQMTERQVLAQGLPMPQ